MNSLYDFCIIRKAGVSVWIGGQVKLKLTLNKVIQGGIHNNS